MDYSKLHLGQRFERLFSDRALYNSHWQEIALRVWPDRSTFIAERPVGAKRGDWLMEETAALALNKFAAACESMLCPRTQKWHKLQCPSLDGDDEVDRWCEQVTDLLFKIRYRADANFASQISENFMSIGAFGTGGMFIDDVPGVGIRYKAIHLAEMYVAENCVGQVDTVFRRYKLSARQAYQHWGDECPEKVMVKLENAPDEMLEFVHAVMPRDDREYGNRTFKGMAWASYDMLKDNYEVFHEGGYHSMPYTVGRYITTPNSVYGYGPAMLVLPATKMVNEMEKTLLRAGQLAVNPPMLMQEDGALQMFDMRQGALNRGGIDEQGRQTVQALQWNPKLEWGEEKLEQKRRIINDAFLVTLFQILVDTPEMTATEAMLRAQEKGQLLAPTMGRLQSDILGPMIHREIDILSRGGALPPMPPQLKAAGGVYEVEYQSPFTRLQRSEEGVGIMRTIEAAASIAQYDSSAMQIFDAEEILRQLASINGAPLSIVRTKEVLAAMKQQQMQQQQLQNLVAAAPAAASAAKDFAQAQQTSSQGSPPVVPSYAMGR